MIRLGLALLAGIAIALLAVILVGEPGSLTAEWAGWRLDTTAAAGAILIGILGLLAVAFWQLVIWIGNAPRRAALARAEVRRRDANASLPAMSPRPAASAAAPPTWPTRPPS